MRDRRTERLLIAATFCALGAMIGTCMLGTGQTKPYGPDAGFWPRTRTIGIRSKIPVPGLETAFRYWNDDAQRTLLVADPNGPITIYDGDLVRGSNECPGGNCSAPVASDGRFSWPPTYPYARCEIYLTDNGAASWVTVAHELGHCLGLDHDSRSIVGSGGSTSNAYDRQQLQQMGYAAATRRTPRPHRTPRPRRTPRTRTPR